MSLRDRQHDDDDGPDKQALCPSQVSQIKKVSLGVVQTSLSLARQGSLVNGDIGVKGKPKSAWLLFRSVIIAMIV